MTASAAALLAAGMCLFSSMHRQGEIKLGVKRAPGAGELLLLVGPRHLLKGKC